MTRILKAGIQSRLDDTAPPVAEMLLREIDSPHEYILMRCVARTLSEQLGKVVRAHACNSGELCEGEIAGQVLVYVIDDPLQPVTRQTSIGLIDGDLSGFNVRVGSDGPVIIDLPQAVNAAGNNGALAMLERDVNNIRRTLGRFAPELLETSPLAGHAGCRSSPSGSGLMQRGERLLACGVVCF